MGSTGRAAPTFRCDRLALLRAVHHAELAVPPWPDLNDRSPQGSRAWRAWIHAAWKVPELADAVRHASPALAARLDDLAPDHQIEAADTRKMALALMGYCLRATNRPTPYGLFAGVADASFGPATAVRWGDHHRAVARADGRWLNEVVAHFEGEASVRRTLRVVANDVLERHGSRLVVPWRPRRLDETGTAVREVSLRHSDEVRAAVAMAATPVDYQDLVRKLASDLPSLDSHSAADLLDSLLVHRVLISNLHPPSTETDGLGYFLGQLRRIRVDEVPAVADLVAELRHIHFLMQQHNHTPAASGGAQRAALTERMKARWRTAEPLAVDLRLDADITLPRRVAWEAERAVTTLARVSPHPYGLPAWQEYRQRFLRRYGSGALVPLLELTNPATGIGLPNDFLGTPRSVRPALSRRDNVLLARAQEALAEQQPVEVDDALTDQLALGDPEKMLLQPHVELLAEVQAATAADLDAGRFQIFLRSLSRGWGTLAGGRFAALLADDDVPNDLLGTLARRPTQTPGALPVQLSFPALSQATHITRTPRLVAPLISISEHHEPHPDMIPLSDLAICADDQRLYLVSRSRGQLLEASTPHPLQIECHTPALARFLDEIVRGTSAHLTGPVDQTRVFDWGAARSLPALPRVQQGQCVLSPASWQLRFAGLPGREASVAEWERAFANWRAQWRVPSAVQLEYFDMRLSLDLEDSAQRAWLRSEVTTRSRLGPLTLLEGRERNAFGWSNGRANEFVLLMRSTATSTPAPSVRSATPVRRSDSHLPGASPYVCVRLHGPAHWGRDLIADHVPDLINELGDPMWWLQPSDSPMHALTLLVRLATTHDAGRATAQIGAWTAQLIEAGVLSDCAMVPYRPFIGRWGTGEALAAAEGVLAADAAIIARQLAGAAGGVDERVLAAANLTQIVNAFCNGQDQVRQWFARMPKPEPASALPRDARAQAAHLLGTSDQPLRTCPSPELAVLWANRAEALATYRGRIRHDLADDALRDLCELHLQVAGLTPEEQAAAWRLARAVAFAPVRASTLKGRRD
ncbi:lantibiotic dehydratase [Streptomyces albus]|uniref:lantibiotic dehydratase n=1 Tax=Streptomyces albus TaxID=1888 RepID=UPI0033E68882